MRSRLSKHVKGIKGAEDIYEVVVGPICDPFFTYRPGIVQSLSRCSYTVNIKLTGRLQRNSSSLVKFEQQQRVGISSEVFWESLFVFLRVFFFMGTEGNVEERMTTSEYLAQLLKDKKQLQSFPNAFVHLERILDDGMYSACTTYACMFCACTVIVYFKFPCLHLCTCVRMYFVIIALNIKV